MDLGETVIAILAAGALLLYGTLELWFAPRNASFFKGWKQKLAVILPLCGYIRHMVRVFFVIQSLKKRRNEKWKSIHTSFGFHVC